MSLETKRNLIRQSIAWHKIKGTPKALENFLGYFGIGAQVEENWKYGGEPYFFRLKLSDVAYLNDDGDTFMRLVYAAKNERSWLDAFIFDLQQVENLLHIGTPEVYADVEKIPYAMLTDENLNLKIIPAQVDTSFEKFGVDFASINENRLGIFLILGESDCEVIRAEIVEEEFDGKLYELLRKLWYKWSHNPLVKQYKHHFDIEVLPPEEEEDDEVTGDYLSLYFHFPTRDKIVKVGNPTEPVDRQKIKLLSRYAAANKFLTNKYGEYTSGISKAIVYKIKNYELKIKN